jgi:hypothetical protein
VPLIPDVPPDCALAFPTLNTTATAAIAAASQFLQNKCMNSSK